MKHLLIALVAVCVMAFASTAGAADQTAADQAGKKVSVVNNSEVDIYTLYVSPTNTKDWQANLLEEKTLPNGDKVDVLITRTENAEAWDIKVTNKAGEEMTWIGVPVNKAGQITLLPGGQFTVK